MHARSPSSIPSHPNEPTPWYGSEPTDWNSSEYQCNNCSHLIHHWVSRSILLWPWIIFFHPVGGDGKQGKTDYKSDTRTPRFRNGNRCSCCWMGRRCHRWALPVHDYRIHFLVLFCTRFWFLNFQYSRENSAETSSILANRLLLPAGPKSWTEEDQRWMCRIEYCRKDGGEPKASRNFRIF